MLSPIAIVLAFHSKSRSLLTIIDAYSSSDMYVHDIDSGITVSDQEPVISKETAATAHVDGKNVLGPVVGKFSMQLAIQKAKEAGVGWVVANGKLVKC